MPSGNYTKVGEFKNIYKKVDFASHIITQFNSLIAFHDAIIKNNWACWHQFHDNMPDEEHNSWKDFSIEIGIVKYLSID